MNELTPATELGLRTVEDAIKTAAELAPQSELANSITSQLVARTSATISDVHTHALLTIRTTRDRLDLMEKAIHDHRDRTIQQMKEFISLLTDAEEAARSIDQAIARVGDNLDGSRS